MAEFSAFWHGIAEGIGFLYQGLPWWAWVLLLVGFLALLAWSWKS
jgi:hypothetical protein